MNIAETDYNDVAKGMVLTLLHDNGMTSRYDKIQYPPEYLLEIMSACEIFFGSNPDLLSDDTISNICCGEVDENQDIYGDLPGFNELYDSLDMFIKNYPDTFARTYN